jgi:F0F1-type ATP synthase membrane subunit b/b'
MHVSRQPLSRQRPWLIAGFVLVFIVLLIAVYGYFTEKARPALRNRRKKINDSVSIAIYYEKRANITVVRS